jgi:hypothetical protein
MKKTAVVSAAFRCEQPIYDEVKSIADVSGRSIGNTMNALVKAGLKRYQETGSIDKLIEESK